MYFVIDEILDLEEFGWDGFFTTFMFQTESLEVGLPGFIVRCNRIRRNWIYRVGIPHKDSPI